MNTQNLLTKRNIIGLIIALTLLIAIPLGIYLAQQTQIFKPRASETPPAGPPTIKVIVGEGVTCNGDTCTVKGDKVDLELTSPLGPPQPSGAPVSTSPSPAASPIASPATSPSPSASPGGG